MVQLSTGFAAAWLILPKPADVPFPLCLPEKQASRARNFSQSLAKRRFRGFADAEQGAFGFPPHRIKGIARGTLRKQKAASDM